MTFNFNLNYGYQDLNIEDNLACYKFGELLKTLITLSSPANKQIEIMGYGAVIDEMLEDFNMYFTLSSSLYLEKGLLLTEPKEQLDELEKFIDSINFYENPDFWDDFQLDINTQWEVIRQKASKILKNLNYGNLDIVLDREENYSFLANGEKVFIQSTKARLINKT